LDSDDTASVGRAKAPTGPRKARLDDKLRAVLTEAFRDALMSRYRRLKIEGEVFSRLRSPTAAVTRTDYPNVSAHESVGTAALAAAPYAC
jgi:hypothetical protein